MFQMHSLSKLSRTSCALDLRTFRSKVRLVAVEEVFSPDAAPIAHASENAALVVEIDGHVELGYISCVHDEYSVIPGTSQQSNQDHKGAMDLPYDRL